VIVRKNGRNIFGQRIDGSATSVQSKTVGEVIKRTPSERSGNPADIFPTSKIAVPSYTVMQGYITSEVAMERHGAEALERFTQTITWMDWDTTETGVVVQDNPHTVTGLSNSYTVLIPEEVVALLSGELVFSREVSFITTNTRYGVKYPNGGWEEISIVTLDLISWSDEQDEEIPASLFEIGLWWSRINRRSVNNYDFYIGDVLNLYGFPMQSTAMLGLNDDDFSDAVRAYRSVVRRYDSLIWLAIATEIHSKPKARPSRARPIYTRSPGTPADSESGFVEALGVLDHINVIQGSVSIKDVIVAHHKEISITDLRTILESNIELSDALPYYRAGVKDTDAIIKHVENGIDPHMASEMSGII